MRITFTDPVGKMARCIIPTPGSRLARVAALKARSQQRQQARCVRTGREFGNDEEEAEVQQEKQKQNDDSKNSLKFVYNADTHAVVLYNTCYGGFGISERLKKELGPSSISSSRWSLQQIDNKPLLAAMERIGSMGEASYCSMRSLVVARNMIKYVQISEFQGKEEVCLTGCRSNVRNEFTHSTVVTVLPVGTNSHTYVMFQDRMVRPDCKEFGDTELSNSDSSELVEWKDRTCAWFARKQQLLKQSKEAKRQAQKRLEKANRKAQVNIMGDFMEEKMLALGYIQGKGDWRVFIGGHPWAPSTVTFYHRQRLIPIGVHPSLISTNLIVQQMMLLGLDGM